MRWIDLFKLKSGRYISFLSLKVISLDIFIVWKITSSLFYLPHKNTCEKKIKKLYRAITPQSTLLIVPLFSPTMSIMAKLHRAYFGSSFPTSFSLFPFPFSYFFFLCEIIFGHDSKYRPKPIWYCQNRVKMEGPEPISWHNTMKYRYFPKLPIFRRNRVALPKPIWYGRVYSALVEKKLLLDRKWLK